MTEEEARQLRKENEELREALKQTQELLGVALARIEELEQAKTPPPSFVKANKQKPQAEEKKPRKKREAQYNRARKRSVPTHIVEHRIVECPACHLRLGGISLAGYREVIDVPPPPMVEVTEHRIYKGWCSGCQHWHEAPVDFSEQVIGQGRIGVRLASMIAYNNLAERSVRPLVIARKISGGTRSPKGSQTRMGLASLFGTWTAQQLNPFRQCLALLTSPSSLGQV